MSDKRICALPRRELEGKDEDCKHGSYQRPHYFLSDSLLLLAPLHGNADSLKIYIFLNLEHKPHNINFVVKKKVTVTTCTFIEFWPKDL